MKNTVPKRGRYIRYGTVHTSTLENWRHYDLPKYRGLAVFRTGQNRFQYRCCQGLKYSYPFSKIFAATKICYRDVLPKVRTLSSTIKIYQAAVAFEKTVARASEGFYWAGKDK
jgi:hypothetical protein